MHAFESGTQSADIAAEQAKLLWTDAVILQFPMWWFSMPAILSGWVEWVYAYGFAYGIGERSDHALTTCRRSSSIARGA